MAELETAAGLRGTRSTDVTCGVGAFGSADCAGLAAATAVLVDANRKRVVRLRRWPLRSRGAFAGAWTTRKTKEHLGGDPVGYERHCPSTTGGRSPSTRTRYTYYTLIRYSYTRNIL